MTRPKKPDPASLMVPSAGEFILYQTEDGQTHIECRFEDRTVWLTQRLIADLFQKDVRTINEHLLNIFEEGELSADSVIRNFRITASDGKTYETKHYNLDTILAVGYRVHSPRAREEYEAFRQRRLAQADAAAEEDTLQALTVLARTPPPRTPRSRKKRKR